ncbi:MAG: hypothetical protein IK092_01540 [Muribaculaceae bacterium]|nr:hypothetical protein [Muribaculaceae bacterium]
MAQDLQETLARIVNKSNILLEKYRVLEAEKERVEGELAERDKELSELRKKIEGLERDNHYLTVARSLSGSSAQLSQSRALISKLVRDIDKCISQLNE